MFCGTLILLSLELRQTNEPLLSRLFLPRRRPLLRDDRLLAVCVKAILSLIVNLLAGACQWIAPAEGWQQAQWYKHQQSLRILTGQEQKLAAKVIRGQREKGTCQFRRKLAAVLPSPGSNTLEEWE